MRLADARSALKRRRSDRSYSNAALNGFLNDARRDIESRKRWSWLRRTHRYATTAQDSTSITTFAATQGSRIATISTPGPVTLWGKRMLVSDTTVRVLNLDSAGTSLTLDAPWTASSVTAQTATVLYDEIALPLDADAALQVVLRDSTGYASRLNAAAQDDAARWDPSTSGEPYHYCVIRREPTPAPVSAPAAADSGSGSGPAQGSYKYWYSFVDKQSGAESGLSPYVEFTQPAPPLHAVTVTPPSRRDFLTRIYRSRVGGSVPYFLGDVTTYGGDFTDTITDQYLGGRGPESGTEAFMRVWPVPNSVYSIEVTCLVRGVDLADDNDRPLFPATFDNVWLDGAEMRMLGAADEQGRAGAPQQRFEAGIQAMMRQDTVEASKFIEIGGRANFDHGFDVGWPDTIVSP